MTKHKNFTVATNVKVNFCDPQSPWQRGTNENTNRLLRQYLPKRTDLSGYTQSQLDKIALRLNQRPRKTLGFQLQRVNFAQVLRRPPEPAASNRTSGFGLVCEAWACYYRAIFCNVYKISLRSSSLALPNKRRSWFRYLASLPELPHRPSSTAFLLKTAGAFAGLSPS